MNVGRRVQIMFDIFKPTEGYNSVYYGKVRNGKTRTATADILELLDRGEIVYANWKINYDGGDERDSFSAMLFKTVFMKKRFYVYGKDNFHYIDRDELISGKGKMNIKYLNRLVGVHLFIDEGQWVLPSMDRAWDEDMMEKMKLVLHGGHYCRTLNIITQRASNISKNTRSQIHFWNRCVKKIDFLGFMVFQRFQIEDMKEDMPVEYEENKDGHKKPVGKLKVYVVNKLTDRVFKAYDTHAMRSEDAIEPSRVFEAYDLTFRERVASLIYLLINKFKRAKVQRNPEAL